MAYLSRQAKETIGRLETVTIQQQEGLGKQVRELEAEVKAMGDKIMYLKEKNKSSDKDGAGADMEVFEIMVHKLRKEF